MRRTRRQSALLVAYLFGWNALFDRGEQKSAGSYANECLNFAKSSGISYSRKYRMTGVCYSVGLTRLKVMCIGEQSDQETFVVIQKMAQNGRYHHEQRPGSRSWLETVKWGPKQSTSLAELGQSRDDQGAMRYWKPALLDSAESTSPLATNTLVWSTCLIECALERYSVCLRLAVHSKYKFYLVKHKATWCQKYIWFRHFGKVLYLT